MSTRAVRVFLSWNGRTARFTAPASETILEIKQRIQTVTQVDVSRQQLFGMRGYEDLADPDSAEIGQFARQRKVRIKMIGSVEEFEDREDDPDVVDDLNFDYVPSVESAPEVGDDVASELRRVIEGTTIDMMNPLRPGKKLLVLDIDYALFDVGSMRQPIPPQHLKRPYLDELLTAVYPYYDICFWSQTPWRWIEIKLTEMGLLSPLVPYKISFIVDKTSMFKFYNSEYQKRHSVKPLAVIWEQFRQYNATNTVHVDDLSRNFYFNARNGIRVSKFKVSKRSTDVELVWLREYLILLASVPDIMQIDLSKWKKKRRGQIVLRQRE